MWEIVPENLIAAMKRAGISQTQLAKAVGVTQPSIGRLISGQSKTSRAIDGIAATLRTSVGYLKGTEPEPVELFVPVGFTKADLLAEMGLIGIPELDRKLRFKASYLEAPVTGAVRYFDKEWLEAYTLSAPQNLTWATELGDAMEPTILNTDLLLFDLSQKAVDLADKVWAIKMDDCIAVKRLRPVGEFAIEVISDKANVPLRTVSSSDVKVLGRVVAKIRRM